MCRKCLHIYLQFKNRPFAGQDIYVHWLYALVCEGHIVSYYICSHFLSGWVRCHSGGWFATHTRSTHLWGAKAVQFHTYLQCWVTSWPPYSEHIDIPIWFSIRFNPGNYLHYFFILFILPSWFVLAFAGRLPNDLDSGLRQLRQSSRKGHHMIPHAKKTAWCFPGMTEFQNVHEG